MLTDALRCTLVLVVLGLAGCGPKMHLVPPLADQDPEPTLPAVNAGTLVPTLAGPGFWAVSAGGPGPDGARLVVDKQGNTILAGEFRDTAFFGTTTVTATAPGVSSPFVAKLSPEGSFLWAIAADVVCDYPPEPDILVQRTIGILFGLVGLGVDGAGNIYVAAPFTGSGAFGSIRFASKGATDLVVAKLSPEGEVRWAVSAGGAGDDVPVALAVDPAGNVTVTGYFAGHAAFGGVQLAAKGASDIFVARLDTAGNIVWAAQAGGHLPSAPVELGSAIALDAAGNAYVGGQLVGTATFGSHTIATDAPGHSGFVAKLDPAGTFLWAAEVAPKEPWWRWISAIALDASGNSYLAGAVGPCAAAVAKLDPSGKPVWLRRASGDGPSWANGIVVDSAGRATISATFAGTTGLGEVQLTSQGNRDVLLAQLDAAGHVVAADQAGGYRLDNTCGLAADSDGNLHVGGYFHDTAVFGGATLTSRGHMDIFVWKRPSF